MFQGLMCWMLTIQIHAQVVEEMTVVLREIRVHVTDKDGQPIQGLQAEDFLIEENGSRKAIDFFREENRSEVVSRETSGLESQEQRREVNPGVTVLLMDTSNLHRRDFPKVKDAAAKIIDEFGLSSDLFKLVQFDDFLIHLTPFTSDRTALRAALEIAKYRGLMRSRLEFQEKEMVRRYEELLRSDYLTRKLAVTDLEMALDQKAQMKLDHQRNFQRNMTALVHLLRSMPGEKTVFFLTGGNYIVQESGLYNTKGENRALIRNLNAANVTLYTLFFGSKDPIGFSHRNATLPQTAVDIARLPGSRREVFENAFQLETGPADLSKYTGGFFDRVLGVAKVDDAVEDLVEKTSHYYSLGYTIDAPSKAKIKVKLAKAFPQKVRLRYGERFVRPETYLELDEPKQVLTFEAMLFYSQAFRNDLDAEAGVALFLAPDQGMAVPVTLRFPLESIPEKGFEVGLSLLSADREVVDVTKSVVKNPPKCDTLCIYDVLLPSRVPKFFRYSIRDLDHDMFCVGEKTLDGSLQPKSTIHVSNMLFGAVDIMGLVPLNHVRLKGNDNEKFRKVNEPRVTNDPFHMGSYLFTPEIDPVFSMPMQLEVFFHVLGTKGKLTRLTAKFFAVADSNVTELPGGIVDVASSSDDRMHCVARFATGMLAPGKYQLLAQVTELASGVAMSREVPFEITP